MLRDLVVFCALVPWTTTSIEDAMLLHRGLRHRKTYEMLVELERAGALQAIHENGQVSWATTEKGVSSFIQGTRKVIPASLVQAALTLAGVKKYGESEAPQPPFLAVLLH